MSTMWLGTVVVGNYENMISTYGHPDVLILLGVTVKLDGFRLVLHVEGERNNQVVAVVHLQTTHIGYNKILQ